MTKEAPPGSDSSCFQSIRRTSYFLSERAVRQIQIITAQVCFKTLFKLFDGELERITKPLVFIPQHGYNISELALLQADLHHFTPEVPSSVLTTLSGLGSRLRVIHVTEKRDNLFRHEIGMLYI